MDEYTNQPSQRPQNPRRRKRSQTQVFKETYLPVIIAVLALVMMIVFIAGGISRYQADKAAKLAADKAQKELLDAQTREASEILQRVDSLIAGYDYDSALALIDKFSGNISDFSELSQKRQECVSAKNSLVAWNDPSKVLSLSFHMLIADPQRAYNNTDYGEAFNRDFVTTDEFTRILLQLYENGYILVSLDDIVEFGVDGDAQTTCTAKTLYLPEGKKPLILVQTGVNYNNYLVDSDGDLIADQDGGGFACKLLVGADGKFTSEMVTADGQTVTGNYDLVTILEDFINAHPDFSYQDAKAIIAVSGYDGILGYRTNPSAKEKLGAEAYDQEVTSAKAVVSALKESGYELACYTYNNVAYGSYSSTEIQSDLNKWASEVAPIVGDTDILVLAKNSDLDSYTDSRYETLRNAGFRYFLGFCGDSGSWAELGSTYFRLGRYLVSGSTMTYHSDRYQGAFQCPSVLDPARGTVPN